MYVFRMECSRTLFRNSETLRDFELFEPQQQVSARLPKTFHADRHDVSEIIVCLVLVPCISARELESKIV